MGFASLIATQVQNAMLILGQDDGLAPAHTYVSADLAGSSYDPETGVMTNAETLYTNVPMVLARFKVDEMDESVVPLTDFKVLIAALDLAATPKVQDHIRLTDGREFMIERVMGVPGNGLHILHVRLTE